MENSPVKKIQHFLRLAESAKSFRAQLPSIQRHNESLQRTRRFLKSGQSITRAQRVFKEQTRRINEYYEEFRSFHFSLLHALNGLGGDIPADKLARLLKNVDPSGRGYRVNAACEAALQSVEILSELYQFPISDQEKAQMGYLLDSGNPKM